MGTRTQQSTVWIWLGAVWVGATVYGVSLWAGIFSALGGALRELYLRQYLIEKTVPFVDLSNQVVAGGLLLLSAPLLILKLERGRASFVSLFVLVLTGTYSLVLASWGLLWNPAALMLAVLSSQLWIIMMKQWRGKRTALVDPALPSGEILPPRQESSSTTQAPFPHP